MYLKIATASYGRTLLHCGMSLGPGAAGGYLTSATLSGRVRPMLKSQHNCSRNSAKNIQS